VAVEEAWKRLHPPPETASITMILKLLAMLQHELRHPAEPHAASGGLEHFRDAIECDFEGNGATQQLKIFEAKAEELREICGLLGPVFSEPGMEKWTSWGGFSSLMGVMCTNALGCGTSSLDAYRSRVYQILSREVDSDDTTDDEAEAESGAAVEATETLEEIYNRIEARVGPFQVCDGSAMFVRQSAMNHSCDPSTVATYPANNACVEIVATRMIPEGEEITMCYVEGLQEEDVPTEQRQAELRGYYLFSCACRRCKDDVAGGSSDGSDDSE